MILSTCVYDRILVPKLRRVTRNERYQYPHGDRYWYDDHYVGNLLVSTTGLLILVGLQEYFYDQSPESMRSLGIAFYPCVLGVADFFQQYIDSFYWLLAGMNLILYTLFIFVAYLVCCVF